MKLNPEKYLQNLKRELRELKSSSTKTPKTQTRGSHRITPTFLIGFPRSGTTLLGTILGSHSKIAVVEEKPALHNTKSFLAENGYYNFTKQLIEPKQLAKAREIYDFEFKKHISGVTRNLVFIDKLPLNLLHLPLIQQLYPDAKFILALRHPLDAILSCWMQNFDLNNEMAIMLDLNQNCKFLLSCDGNIENIQTHL